MYTELGLRLPSRQLRPVPFLYHNAKGVIEPCFHPSCSNLDLHPSHPLDMLSYDSSAMPIKAPRAPASVPLPPSLQATPTTPSPLASLNSTTVNGHSAKDQQHIWLVTGPAGCGKSTIAEYLANTLNMPYIEGDSVSVTLPFCGVPRVAAACSGLHGLTTNTTCSSTLLPTSKKCAPALL